MIYFISNRVEQHKVKESDVLKVLDMNDFIMKEHFDNICNLPLIGLDTETNGLDAYKNQVLLVIVGDKENQYVIDWTCKTAIKVILSKKCTFIGHNLKFDYKMIKGSYGVELDTLYDTMIAEQRISQNYTSKRYKGFISFSLEEVIKRRLKLFENGMGKDIRLDFIGKDPETFQCENKHIIYAANDIKYLFDIKEQQDKAIKLNKLELLIYDIEFPLIKVLAEAELEGWILNEEKWLALAEKNRSVRADIEISLDSALRKLRDSLLSAEEQVYLKNGRYDRVRQVKQELPQYDLFGELIDDTKAKKIETSRNAYVNYASASELITILGRLKSPVPTKEGSYAVPEFKKDKRGKYVVDKTFHSFTTGAGAIENYLAEHPDTPIKDFILLLIEFREISTRLNTFGEAFIKNYTNSVTNKVHTVFRQMNTSTGRLQSGSKRKKVKKGELDVGQENYFNSQNIPADKDYRECFTVEEGYSVVSCDYSGCEAVVMIDKAKDEKFYEFAIKNDDAHSPLAQAVWRAIGQLRNDPKLASIVISKKENKHLRNDFKPNTFGVCYGMGVKKYAKTLRVSEEEAKIGLKVQKSMTPKTFKYLETIAKQAITQGYVTINHRTNARVWYPEVLEAIRNKSELENVTKYDIESSARNITIQGTNADIVKEAMVELAKEFKTRNLDAKVIGSVHDEIIVKFNDNITSIETNVKGELLLLSVGQFVKHIMEEVANRYLSFIEMKAEYQELRTWTK